MNLEFDRSFSNNVKSVKYKVFEISPAENDIETKQFLNGTLTKNDFEVFIIVLF
jgi:hypothetical protein